MPKYYGCPCEGCGEPLTLKDDIVVCPDCGAPYHRTCYEKLGRCIHSPAHAAGYEWHFPYQDAELRTCPSCGERTLRSEEICRFCGAALPPETEADEQLNDRKAAQDEQQDDDTLEEDDAHGHVPVTAAHGGGDARDHGIDAQTRRAGERAVSEDAHADGHDASAQAGGAGERPRIDAGAREHRGVDGDDVGHRQECCQSSAKFGPDCGLALADVK